MKTRIMNMEQTLEQMTDQVIYEVMLEERPALVQAVAGALKLGQTPAQIERTMRQRSGNIQMVRNVRHIAEHLARQ